MEHNEIYEKWKERRRNVQVPEHFSRRVMNEIKIHERRQKTALSDALSETGFIFSRMSRFFLAFALSALGIFRISYAAFNLLVP